MPPIWTNEQKKIVTKLYKIGRIFINSKSHVDFLCECLGKNIIPKAFCIKSNIPGDKLENQRKFHDVSLNAMVHEKEKHLKCHEAAI